MITKIDYEDNTYVIDFDSGIDLSINSRFNGESPMFYGAQQPTANPQISDGFIGDLKKGGSCNVPVVSLNVHCTGTHTESISHVFDSNDMITDACPRNFIPACIISVEPEKASLINETYHFDMSNDMVISKQALEQKLDKSYDAMIIRTHPNDISKISRNYDDHPAPFFTNDAMEYINQLKVKHLLVDMPSVDKADDGGLLGNHKIFFKQGRTISELLYVPNELLDGFGFLQIQIPNWNLDSAPSRPIFYPV